MISEKMKVLVKNGSAIRAMFEEGKIMAAKYGKDNIYDFSLGNPSIVPPACVREAIVDLAENEPEMELHGYPNNAGFEDVRQAVADYTNKSFGTHLDASNIIMTVGAAGGINVTLKAIINPGDEVMVIAPYFGEYDNYISNFDGVKVMVNADLERFSINFEDFESKVSPKTRCVIINTPNNPTGAVYTEDDIKKLADILNRKQSEYGTSIYLFSDEPYREIAFGKVDIPYIVNYYKNTVVGYSYSKSLSLPGERIGYLVVPSELDDFREVLDAMVVANRILGFVNAPTLMQKVVKKVIGSTSDLSVYEQNKDILYKALTDIGYECVEPKGTFYMFPKALIPDDKEFCKKAKEFRLIIVPGSNFACPGYFRIAYCVDKKTVENSIQSFKDLYEFYKK